MTAVHSPSDGALLAAAGWLAHLRA